MRRIFPILALAAGAIVVVPPVARAQQRSGAPLVLEPLDWSPTAGWRRRAERVRTERLELLRRGDLRSLNAVRGAGPGGGGRPITFVMGALPTTAVVGAFHLPVIAINYRDIAVAGTPLYPVSAFQCLLFSRQPWTCGNFGDRPYSITSYYEELSQNRITMDGVVLPPVRMDSNAAYYTDGCKGFTIFGQTSCPSRPANRMALMMIAALDSINNGPGGDTIWSQFDNDGPDGQPNSGDDDGTVDFVTFLQPEVGGECIRNDPPPTGIWSHRFIISGWVSSMNAAVRPPSVASGVYLTRTPRRNAAGQAIPGEYLKVNDYTIQSQLGGITSCDGSAIMGIGTVAHETGHAFGLPDLYDTSGGTQGIGGWGLMGSGNYARPYSPSSYDAWSLLVLGWATVDTLGGNRTVTVGPRILTDTIFYARTSNPDEFLLAENRQAVRSDTAQMNPSLSSECPVQMNGRSLGFCAKSPGLLLWLINQAKINGGLSGNGVNVGPVHGVALFQADGLNQLRTPGSTNRGDRGDSYPGSTNNPKLTMLGSPGARGNLGNYLGFVIDQIAQLGNGLMSFRFTRREPSLIEAQGGAIIRVNGQNWTRYEEVIPGGDQVQLAADETQLLAGGKTRTQFLAWSNGGAREQTLVSNPQQPDTVRASFAIEHRLLLVTTGSGTVTSSAAGDLAQGVFLNEGTQVSLTASAGNGLVFAGWRGDTVTTSPTLTLTMQKGYDIEARFIGTVAVALQQAIQGLLGTQPLTLDQKVYLDELGNRNGIYDVGDLLALSRRDGLAAEAVAGAAAVQHAPADSRSPGRPPSSTDESLTTAPLPSAQRRTLSSQNHQGSR
ncbi:MAG: M6 family metalloprotease domain-containing protein [Gemmatimonadales bacterium]